MISRERHDSRVSVLTHWQWSPLGLIDLTNCDEGSSHALFARAAAGLPGSDRLRRVNAGSGADLDDLCDAGSDRDGRRAAGADLRDPKLRLAFHHDGDPPAVNSLVHSADAACV